MTDLDLAEAKANMVEQQLRTWEVLNERILDTLERVPREHYAPAKYSNLAYADMQIPLGHGQVMLEPKVEGRLLQALDPQPTEKTLEIGTGAGYLTHCLAQLSAHVTSVELFPDLREQAEHNLQRAGVDNIHLHTGDAARGWSDGRHYDVIAVTASLPEMHPGFHQSLSMGGRLFLIVGQPPIMEAVLITRVGEDQWATESLFDTSAPALVGAPVSQPFDF
ncbi:protein-L-isoaspartate O-methyltransferase family protein [Spiribacter pallidus]|jgi:protein-L-isoaspartate(D-aspartate) O-methyltransferase|uniref:Protein-L-isoaspartate O-methyltransferase n=1 Tax=Spiribacter pallidus TaxID=1987936 RepID=A0ABV3TF71_9GAMM